MVGLVGYPNVGKSSTINAIFGAKKTAVAPTPGKTKHFQTLNVSPTVCLCDCPGKGPGDNCRPANSFFLSNDMYSNDMLLSCM
jgi:ribosome biogenesis GTPase A